MWGKLFKDTRLIKDTVIELENPDMTRTQKVYASLEEICYEFDLEKPMWLESTKKEFLYHSKARFTSDNFIESIDFDYLEIQIIEEDFTTFIV
jgi:hypothetical protein